MTEPIASALPTPPSGSDEVAELTDRWHRALAEVENTRKLGFQPIDTPGVPFDPQRHEAAEVVRDTGAEPGTVVRVLRPGFAAGDRLLRPAVVVVSALPELPGDTTAGTGDDARRNGGADGG